MSLIFANFIDGFEYIILKNQNSLALNQLVCGKDDGIKSIE